MKYKNLMAKALYDNMPESPEELAFRKGDILTVIEQNTGGLEGWWLCSLHGRQGIAPGNRLKLLVGPSFESQTPGHVGTSTPQQQQQPGQRTPPGFYQVPPCTSSPHQQGQGIYQVPPSSSPSSSSSSCQDVYQVPQRSALATPDGMPNKVVTPTRVGQSYAYSPAHGGSHDLYDIPPTRQQGLYDIPQGKHMPNPGPRTQGLYDVPSAQDTRNQGVYDIPPPSQGVYSIPPYRSATAAAAAEDEGNYDFPQPHKHKAEGLYDVPPHLPSLSKPAPSSNYDFPPSAASNGIYDVPVAQLGPAASRDLYAAPQGAPKKAGKDSDKGVYDVPSPDSRSLSEVTDGVNRLSFSSTSTSSSSTSAASPCDAQRLPADPDRALQRLGQGLQRLEASVSALQGLVASPGWRTYSFAEVRPALERVHAALAETLALGRGAAAHADAVGTPSEPGLQAKLHRQLQRLEESQQSLKAAARHQQGRSEELERLIAVARTLNEDAKQMASTIAGSAELLFRRAPVEGVVRPFTRTPAATMEKEEQEDDEYGGETKPFPVPKDSEECVKSWMEDYDYVHLQGKDEFERQQMDLLEKENIVKQSRVQLGQEQLNKFKQLEQEVIKPVEITHWTSHQHTSSSCSSSSSSSSSASSTSSSSQPSERDRQLLRFYGEQCEQHFVTLLNAVDAFFGCVSTGQPPRVFVAHAKLVILSAHKLVFVGDTVSRQARSSRVSERVTQGGDALCLLLKAVVGATKTAALRYPHAPALQQMVDRVTQLSHHAQMFKTQLLQMAES